MESLSSEQKDLALDILYDIQSAIERLQERTERIHTVDDFLGSPDGMILLDATLSASATINDLKTASSFPAPCFEVLFLFITTCSSRFL